jgi:hypothetical protein
MAIPPPLRKHNDEVQSYAFDILVDGGDDLRKLPLHLQKNSERGAPGALRIFNHRRKGVFQLNRVHSGSREYDR